jgi:hypothetical protein
LTRNNKRTLQIIEAYELEPLEGNNPGAVRLQFGMNEADPVSIEIIPYLNEWGADLILSNNFKVEKHYHHFLQTTHFLETKLGINQYNVFGSNGETLNGYDFERQYLNDKMNKSKATDSESASIMKEWENRKRKLQLIKNNNRLSNRIPFI